MIKSLFSLATIVAVATLVACSDSKTETTGPSTPEEYAKEKAQLEKKIQDAATAGDNGELKKLAPIHQALETEIKNKCANDAKFRAEYEKAFVVEHDNAFAE